MSWFLGIKSKHNRKINPNIKDKVIQVFQQNPTFVYENESTLILANGLSENTFYESKKDYSFFISGIGFINENKFKQLSTKDWRTHLTTNRDEISGVFSGFVVTDGKIELFTDKLGLTAIYVLETEDFFCFSSHLFQLIPFYNASFNMQELVKQHLLSYSNSSETILQNVRKICHNGYGVIDSDFTFHTSIWKPTQENYSYEKLTFLLQDYVREISENASYSLGLSGGIDSRTILALFPNLSVHTFGKSKNPDVIIAKKIVKKLALPHTFFRYDTAKIEAPINKIQKYILETEIHSPLASVQIFDFFSSLNSAEKWLIDGAYFSYLRRTIHNKTLLFHKQHLQVRNTAKLYPIFASNKKEILSTEIINQEQSSALAFLDTALNKISNIENIEIWLELFHLHFHNAQTLPPMQRKYDTVIPNINLGANEVLLNSFFNIPLKQKANCKLNHKIMKEKNAMLLKFEYARWGTSTPIIRGKYLPFLYAFLKRKIIGHYQSPNLEEVLRMLKEDIAARTVRHDFIFNSEKITLEKNNFLAGKTYNPNILSSWYQLDIWNDYLVNNKNAIQIF